jgi:hypothetical protein
MSRQRLLPSKPYPQLIRGSPPGIDFMNLQIGRIFIDKILANFHPETQMQRFLTTMNNTFAFLGISKFRISKSPLITNGRNIHKIDSRIRNVGRAPLPAQPSAPFPAARRFRPPLPFPVMRPRWPLPVARLPDTNFAPWLAGVHPGSMGVSTWGTLLPAPRRPFIIPIDPETDVRLNNSTMTFLSKRE